MEDIVKQIVGGDVKSPYLYIKSKTKVMKKDDLSYYLTVGFVMTIIVLYTLVTVVKTLHHFHII